MRRGFKTWAERMSGELRQALTLAIHAPLPARRLAAYLGHLVILPGEIPDLPQSVATTLYADGSSWSALTLPTPEPLVILNPTHSPARQESDLMHELAHFLSKHKPEGMLKVGELVLRRYNSEQEDEAAWLGACLQLPRTGLVWAIRRGMPALEIAKYFGASEQLVRWRRAQTGVDIQLERWQRLYT